MEDFRAAAEDARLQQLSGSIERVIYANEENGYAVCDLGTDDNDLVTIQGTLPYIAEGDGVTVYGRWVHSPKYGRQFSVERYERVLPADVNAILRYLSSRVIKGIGPKTAQKIVEEFGEDTFDVMENHPEWLAQIPGISRKKAEEISEDFRQKSGIRSAMMFFRDFFGAALTMRIYKRFGSSAVDRAKQNPYILCDEVEGIGFEKADRMAHDLGLSTDSPARLSSGIVYVLHANALQNGHVCLPEDKLLAAAGALLGGTPEQLREALDILLFSHRLKKYAWEGTTYIYEKYAYDNEQYIATKLRLLDRLCVAVDAPDVHSFIDREERKNGLAYASLQRKAIFDALQCGVMILTGGPGTGKTTVVRALLNIFNSMDLRVALTAPTGRAAKRLSESTSSEAKTIHRLLEMEYGDADNERGPHFRRDETNLLEEDVIVIDEASMVGNGLMSSLLKAIKPGARVIIIGDADQLPSVEAGNVLRDLIASECFSTVCLTEIFRQAQESLIVTNAHAINRGEMPRLDVKNNDFFFLRRDSDRDIVLTVADLYKNRLPRTYGEMARTGIQVISPSRKGEGGTENLNVLLQEGLNPQSPGKTQYRFRDKIFREGDRVMQIRNNYDIAWERPDGSTGMGVFNGDIGEIEAINHAGECMEIRFDDRHVVYDFTLLEELEHAYAITVHKSQGSEYPIVIIPLYRAPYMLLTRHLFYTAVTRAQNMVILVGREDVARTMVENHRQSMRYTGLAHRLRDRG
ncbi:MAG: ATP-dependent RecD-like DNA helicase [Clostridia bacterium]|nr:ATP-dependent RecD-like DNA helicase [Clostridia bacterium]